MPTMPYIHFQGQCAEALAFYAKVFGGINLQTMRYSDGPGAPAAWKNSNRVMHGQVTIGDGTLMASDFPPGTEGDPQKGVSIMQTAPDVDTARAAFAQLCEGGAVIEDFKPTFFSPGFGMVKDKFGTHWIISALPPGETVP
ncbi:MAG: VOC family protein [Paracoccaceae bacterium]